MRSGSNFKNMPAALNLQRVDASKFKVLTSSTFEYVTKANKSKETCIPTNESQIKKHPCVDFPSDIKGQRVAHIA